jgi:hypothetical protein
MSWLATAWVAISNCKRPKEGTLAKVCRITLFSVAMLFFARVVNALAPGSARLFSAAASASGENSFKVRYERAIQGIIVDFSCS